MQDIIIIGAGVIGCSIARELAKTSFKVLVLDKEEDVGNETSMANSAIIHSGYDPLPTSKKAYFNCKGNPMFDQIVKDLDVDFKRIGSLTLAENEEECMILKDLQKRSLLNQVETQLLNRDQLLEMEPFLASNVKMGLYAPNAGIINPFELCVALAENAADNGVNFVLGEEVVTIEKQKDFFIVKTNLHQYETKNIINAAGLCADKIANMVNDYSFTIEPRQGQYLVLDHFKAPFIHHIIFPTPSEKGKGVLLTPTTDGNYLLGPTSEFVKDKDDFSTSKQALDEIRKKVGLYINPIPFHQIIRSFTGLRAVNVTSHDFIVEESKVVNHFYHVGGIESPGLASSLAIAEEVVCLIKEKNSFLLNPSFDPKRRPLIKLKRYSLEERNKIIQKDPRFGHIICRCESVSIGEIVDVIHRKIGAKTIQGVKKRIRPGAGKCQGSFCEPLILEVLSKELHKDPLELHYCSSKDFVFFAKTKEMEENK